MLVLFLKRNLIFLNIKRFFINQKLIFRKILNFIKILFFLPVYLRYEEIL